MRERAARGLAAIGALVGATGLMLQFVIMYGAMTTDGVSAGGVMWRFLGYFTILSNILVTLIFARAAIRPQHVDERVATVEALGVTAIVFVGAIYHALLAKLWNPQGAQLVADILLHTITPIVFVLFWMARPHGALKWRDALICAIWPLVYAVYALARGAGDGWYAYPFLNGATLSAGALALNVAGLSAIFLLEAFAIVGLDRLLAQRAP